MSLPNRPIELKLYLLPPFQNRNSETIKTRRIYNCALYLSLSVLAELLLEEVVPLEPVEEDEERDEARATEATRRRASGLPFTRVPPLRAGGDLDGPRGRDTAASEPARQTSLLPGHAQHRWAQVFQLQDRSRTGPVVTQVGTVPPPFFLFSSFSLSFSLSLPPSFSLTVTKLNQPLLKAVK